MVCAGGRHEPARTARRSSCHLKLSPPHDRGAGAPQSERGRMTAIEIAVTINGRAHRLAVPPRRVLADLLREDLQLLGCKIGCDQAVCGACTVLVDDMPVTACTTFAFELDGKALTTIEGLAEDGGIDPIQHAFLQHSAFQCGFCTPGMI